jgi:mannose-6-phosphate isomerase-like protein (cupin superfamily)
MDELDKGMQIALGAEKATEVVRRIHRQMRKWGLKLPDVAPLALDFGLGDFGATGETEFWITNEIDAGYCGKFLFLFKGQTCPKHMHKVKRETFFVVKGRVRMVKDDQVLTMKAGDVLRMDRECLHSFSALKPTLLLEVSQPSIISDNYFDNPDIPIGGNYRKRQG